MLTNLKKILSSSGKPLLELDYVECKAETVDGTYLAGTTLEGDDIFEKVNLIGIVDDINLKLYRSVVTGVIYGTY